MANISLQHSVNSGVHTFNDGDISLKVSGIKVDHHGNVRAYIRAMVGDASAGSSNVNLTDQESRAKFDFYAHKNQPDIDWLECVTQMNDILLEWLDGKANAPTKKENGVVIETLDSLMKEKFPEVHPIIDGILMPGVSLLAGKPKVGKSMLALYIGWSVALGGRALGGIKVDQGDVLYLSLEDHKRRLQKRLIEIRNGIKTSNVPLYFATKWPRLDDGGIDEMDAWLQAHPNAKLVVVDTFVKVRGKSTSRDVYTSDYDSMSPLTDLAKKYPQVCILVIHHCSKRSDAEDFFDRFHNSTGLTAAVEGGAELCRKRGENECTLEIAHKDLDIDAKYSLKIDPECGWKLLGDAHTFSNVPPEQQKLADTIWEKSPETGMNASELSTWLKKDEATVRMLLSRMKHSERVTSLKRGRYVPTIPHSNSKNDVITVTNVTDVTSVTMLHSPNITNVTSSPNCDVTFQDIENKGESD